MYLFELWFFLIYAQEWDCWMIWQFYSEFSDEPPYCFPQWLHQLAFPPAVQEGSLFSTPSPAFIVCRFSDDAHSDRCEVISHCSFFFFLDHRDLGSCYYFILFYFLFIYFLNYLFLFIFLTLFIFYLFMAVLGLCFCARAFSSCGKRGPLFIAVRGPLTFAASLVAEHSLQTRRLSSCGSQA